MRCLRCHADNRDGISFCEECGAKLEQACPACGTRLPPGRKFCGVCGQPLARPPGAGQAETPHGVREETANPAATEPAKRPAPDAERRQLTVMFCDLVESTALSAALDPEDLREVMQAHHELCAKLIGRFDGHIAQYLGDGILAYFGYPMAHEDDGARAVRAALQIVQEMAILNLRLRQERGVSLAVRLGIHTGLVVIGEIGEEGKHGNLALGHTPNIAARAQAIAEPDTVVITAATHRLVRNLFDCLDLGSHALKGVAAPLRLYRVLGDRDAGGGFEAEAVSRWPPVGREKELGLLLERWEQVKDGAGQVVLLNGEAGIGKSRLAQVVREKVFSEGCPTIEYRCSAYYQNSALYPIISHLWRLFQCDESDSPEAKLAKIENGLQHYRLPLPEVIPLLASLLGVPFSDRYPSLNLTPQRQKQKTVEVLLAWILEEAERQPVLFVVEDLHWADPSTVDFLGLLAEQAATARILVVLTSRPDFTPSWPARPYLTHIFLSRVSDRDVEAIVRNVTGGKALPAEVLRQVMAKTDGVPLFVEELTKMVLESGLLMEEDSGYRLSGPVPSLAIPATLHDSLMARLDRLSTVKEVAQLAAVLGREFSYQLLEAIARLDRATLDGALALLVEAEFLLQRGAPPRSRYTFKHALIQEVAYQSTLKSKRQGLHRRIAQVLEERLPETAQEQPEFLAHHYTEAGLTAPAIVYWVQAGQRAVERSANAEAIRHLGHALDLLSTPPETPERAPQELAVQMLLAQALMATRGMAAPEVERAYARARELCEAVGHSDQLLLALGGLGTFYLVRGNIHAALETGEQCLDVAQRLGDPDLLLKAHAGQGTALVFLGELESGRAHLADGIRLSEATTRPTLDFGGRDAGVGSLVFDAWASCLLGRPDEALASLAAALALAGKRSHPFSLVFTLSWAARLHEFRREEHLCREQAETAIGLAVEYGFTQWQAIATMLRGSAMTAEGRVDEGIDQLREGLAAWRAMGAELLRPYFLALLAEAYWRIGWVDEGLATVVEGLSLVERTGERMYEAELHRLQGELLRARESGTGPAPALTDTAGACFRRALEVARRQGARALELRAAMSLTRLLEPADGRAREEARRALAEVYATFNAGFDTADLREAKALLDSRLP